MTVICFALLKAFGIWRGMTGGVVACQLLCIHMVFASDVRMLLGRPRTRVWRPSRTRVRCGGARRPSPTTLRHSGRRVLHGTNSNSSNRLRRWPCDKTRCVLRACRRRPIRLVGVPLSCALRREACTLGASCEPACLAGPAARRGGGSAPMKF